MHSTPGMDSHVLGIQTAGTEYISPVFGGLLLDVITHTHIHNPILYTLYVRYSWTLHVFLRQDLRSAPPYQISPWSVQGWGFTADKTYKNWNFTNIIAPKGRVLCTILTKFSGFMRVHSLQKIAIFGCFSSINDKIIDNLPRWRRFQPNFWWPLAAKLLMEPKQVWGWNDGTDHLYHHAKFGGNRTTHGGVRVGYRVWCFSLFCI